ncbi:MAG: tRNA lysidine(34) synthetase TilS [Candidatus Sericytochromatia bacterium]
MPADAADMPKAFSDRSCCSRIFGLLSAQELIPPGSHCLLAVSGGLDSMVLLDFFRRFAGKKYRAGFLVAHLDHGLREDAAAVAAWLSETCAAYGVTCISQRIEIRDLQRQSAQSSLEAVARQARYDWLEQTALAQGCDRVVTAHSASDQFETILMRLIRGGIAGLGGMPPQRRLGQVRLIRPLLGLTRAELEAYAVSHRLQWREDPSNQAPEFFRNRVRAELAPWLRRENPALEQTLAEQAAIWRDEQDWLQQQAEVLFAEHVSRTDQGLELSVAALLELPPALQRRLLRELLGAHLGAWKLYSHGHIEAIRGLAAGPGSKVLDLPGRLQVCKQKKTLLFRKSRL